MVALEFTRENNQISILTPFDDSVDVFDRQVTQIIGASGGNWFLVHFMSVNISLLFLASDVVAGSPRASFTGKLQKDKMQFSAMIREEEKPLWFGKDDDDLIWLGFQPIEF